MLMRDWVDAFSSISLVSEIITAMNKFTIQIVPKNSIITKRVRAIYNISRVSLPNSVSAKTRSM